MVNINHYEHKSESRKNLRKYVKQELKEIIDKRPKFKQQLIQRGVYGIYVSTATKYICKQYSKDVEYKLDCIAINSTPIDSSMCWKHTKQGHDYWQNINNEFSWIKDGFTRHK